MLPRNWQKGQRKITSKRAQGRMSPANTKLQCLTTYGQGTRTWYTGCTGHKVSKSGWRGWGGGQLVTCASKQGGANLACGVKVTFKEIDFGGLLLWRKSCRHVVVHD